VLVYHRHRASLAPTRRGGPRRGAGISNQPALARQRPAPSAHAAHALHHPATCPRLIDRMQGGQGGAGRLHLVVQRQPVEADGGNGAGGAPAGGDGPLLSATPCLVLSLLPRHVISDAPPARPLPALQGTGVDVCAVQPGMSQTDFFRKMVRRGAVCTGAGWVRWLGERSDEESRISPNRFSKKHASSTPLRPVTSPCPLYGSPHRITVHIQHTH